MTALPRKKSTALAEAKRHLSNELICFWFLHLVRFVCCCVWSKIKGTSFDFQTVVSLEVISMDRMVSLQFKFHSFIVG